MPASYDMRAEGLGTLAVLPDRILVKIFTCLLKTDAKLLLPLSPVSKAFCAFVEEETLWKDLVIRRCAGDFTFKGSWKLTHFLPRNVFPPEPLKRIDVHDLNSDYLQRKWKISNAPIGDYEALPELSPGEASFFRVDRRANLSLEEFEREYAAKNRPVIITDAIQHWPAWTSWTEKNLLKKLEGVSCRMDEVGPDGTKIHMTFSDYLQYAHNYHDDDPIYYFDPNFADKTPSLLDDYEIPEYFADDAFSLLDLDDRPYFRWIVIGPKRSGSPFHVDPFFTSAWNALFKGTKRWALYPPEAIPPGVKGYWGKRGNWKTINPPDPMEWYLFTYPAIQDTPLRPIECIQHPGDLIFIPSGWWYVHSFLLPQLPTNYKTLNARWSSLFSLFLSFSLSLSLSRSLPCP
ncbi:JmjC domain-containing protein, variant 2 [Balamuthia mandrillaris]